MHHYLAEGIAMINSLETLFEDSKLYALFGNDKNLTVSQIWLFEIVREGSSELRFLYARTLPSTYMSDSWSGKVSSKAKLDENCYVNIHTLTLNTSSNKLKSFLESFTCGKTLQEASEIAELNINNKLAYAVGKSIFGESYIIRSTMHLPTREYYRPSSRLSPTSYSSVDSGAISPECKPNVFNTPEGFDMLLLEAACQTLDADTGLNFSKLDSWRISDFEFICAQGLNSSERCKFDISLKGEQSCLTLYESLTREPSDLLVIINAYSDGCVESSYITKLSKESSYPISHFFELKSFQNQAGTAYTMEIYAQGVNGGSFLVLQTGNRFLRQMEFNLQLIEPINSNESFSWLEKKVPNKEKVKLKAAKQVGRTKLPSRSQMSNYIADPWVPLNRLIQNRVRQLSPDKSDGHFFPTLDDSNGMSRLDLQAWLEAVCEKHDDAKIAWIDPYMEDVGIELLNRLGTKNANYLIITTEKNSNDDSIKEPSKATRIDNLLEKCSCWNNGYFGSIDLKVLAVPDNKLHDRMLLIRSVNGQPLAGYHLSNSIQRASENHPLLVTPIPLDVIPYVFSYIDQIIQSTLYEHGKTPVSARIIFDSSDIKPQYQEKSEELSHYLSFTDHPYAGNVIAWWLDDNQLIGLYGPKLMKLMSAKDYIEEGGLDSARFDALPSKFWSEGLPLPDFSSYWDALCIVIASSQASRYTGGLYNKEQSVLSEPVKIALLEHISPSRANALQPRFKKAQIDIEYYRSQTLVELLLSNCNPIEVFNHSTIDTSWSDYYSVNLLWQGDPQLLVSWLDNVLSESIDQPRTLALVIETLRHICLCVSLNKHHKQIDALLHSNMSIITWIGVHALSSAIISHNWGVEALTKINHIKPEAVQQTVLCWMIGETNYLSSNIQPQLIAFLTQSLKAPIKNEEFTSILKPIRSNNGKLYNLKPWILESMIIPMMKHRVIDITLVANQWLTELIDQWQTALKSNNLSFTVESDGAFTDELAVMIRYLSEPVQEVIFKELKKVFDKLARTIRRPMSAQVSWSSFSNAHQINLWLYALLKRIVILLQHKSLIASQLLQESEDIIERISPPTMSSLSIKRLLIYIEYEPEKIRSHHLHKMIQSALALL